MVHSHTDRAPPTRCTAHLVHHVSVAQVEGLLSSSARSATLALLRRYGVGGIEEVRDYTSEGKAHRVNAFMETLEPNALLVHPRAAHGAPPHRAPSPRWHVLTYTMVLDLYC